MKKNALFTRSLIAMAIISTYSSAFANEIIDTTELDTVNVIGSAGKIDNLKFKSAQSNAKISAKEIAETAAIKVEDTLKYESGIQVGMYGYDTKQEWIKIRGFDASVSADGAPLAQNGFFTYIPNTYGLESVEVIKGADSITYGSAETGGLVNMVSKRPTQTAQGEVGLSLGNKGQRGIFGDYSGKLSADNSVRYRVVGEYFHKEGDLNGTKTHNYYIAPSLTWDISDKTTLTGLASFSRQQGIPTNPHRPANATLIPATAGVVARETNLGEPDIDYVKRNQASIGYELKHNFGNGWNFSQNYRYNRLDLDWLGVFALYSDGNRTAYRGYSYSDGITNTHTIDNRMSKEWQGNGWKNTTLFGIDYLHSKTDGLNKGYSSVNALDMFTPVYGKGGIVKSGTPYNIKQKQLGLYLRNQLTYGQWVANVGVRRDQVKSDSLSSGTKSSYDIGHTSYQASAMYHFKNGISPYASYTESFKPISGADSYGNSYKPYEGRQYEVGVKYIPSWLDGKLSAAYFNLEEKNALVSDASAVMRQIGKRTGKGIELQADANITDNLSATLAYTHTKSEQDLSYNKRIASPLIPKHQASAQIKYRFDQGTLNGLMLGAGVRYVGSTTDEQYHSGYKVPAYTVVDAMAQYNFAKNWQAQLNVTNLTDKNYLAGCSYYCYYGEARSIVGKVSYKF